LPFRQEERSEASSTTETLNTQTTHVPTVPSNGTITRTVQIVTSVPSTTYVPTIKRRRPCPTTPVPKKICPEDSLTALKPTVPSVVPRKSITTNVPTPKRFTTTAIVPTKRTTEISRWKYYTTRGWNTYSTDSYRYFWNERNGWDRYQIGVPYSSSVPYSTVPTTSRSTYPTESSSSVPFTETSVATVPPTLGNTPVPEVKNQENDAAMMLAYGLGIGTGCINKLNLKLFLKLISNFSFSFNRMHDYVVCFTTGMAMRTSGKYG